MTALPPSDVYHLRAAEGWLDLGNHLEANEELERISPELRAHPDVLILRWQIYGRAEKWEPCLIVARALTEQSPNDLRGWIALAASFRAMKRTEQAYEILHAKSDQIPTSWQLAYDTARYASMLGRRADAERYLARAIDAGDPNGIKLRALDDPDLKNLWKAEN